MGSGAEPTTTRTAGGLDFTAIGGKRQGREVPQSLETTRFGKPNNFYDRIAGIHYWILEPMSLIVPQTLPYWPQCNFSERYTRSGLGALTGISLFFVP